MKLTFYTTPGHGYLRVPKSTFLKVGGNPDKISGFSGHDMKTLYLEEDCDAGYFLDLLKENEIEYSISEKYVNSVSPTHNYNSKLFDFKYINGLKVQLHDDTVGVLEVFSNRTLIHIGHMTYLMPKTNPFNHIKSVI